MEAEDIEIGVTYTGTVDWGRGLGSHRTVIGIADDLVSFRVEVGDHPPSCYISHANMRLAEFAAWASGRVPASSPSPSI